MLTWYEIRDSIVPSYSLSIYTLCTAHSQPFKGVAHHLQNTASFIIKHMLPWNAIQFLEKVHKQFIKAESQSSSDTYLIFHHVKSINQLKQKEMCLRAV